MSKTIKLFLFVFTVIICFSCGNESNSEVIYKTKSGEYASKTGKFIAKFPTEPVYSIVEREFGHETLEVHAFRTVLGLNKIFAVDYIDYPEAYIKQMSDEEILKQAMINYIYQASDSFELDFEKPIEQHGLNGQYFVLRLNENMSKKGAKGHVLVQVFKKENRVYSISYLGHNDKQTGEFLDSFRLF